MRTSIVDTGPLVAYLDKRDERHGQVAEFIDNYKGRLITTSAVIGEVMYFVSDLHNGPISFASLLIASDIRVPASAAPEQVLRAAELMKKYADTPMDYADATLVLLAEEMGILEIVTLDGRGFSTYRTRKGKHFQLPLGPQT